jgi:predicted DCC family thiol-disulfide oxidoreductase YuxK
MGAHEKIIVYFDGTCPLCRREIDFYRDCRGSESIDWVDASQASPEQLGPDLNKEKAMSRFHVRDKEGELYSGGAGFTELWQSLYGFRLLSAFFRLPVICILFEWFYLFSLKVRPRLKMYFEERK